MALSVNERVQNLRARKRLANESTSIDRALYVFARHAANPNEYPSPMAGARALFEDDTATRAVVRGMFTRAQSAPADTVTSGWGSDVAVPGRGEFLGTLQRVGQIFSLAEQTDLTGMPSKIFPKRTAAIAASDVTWVGQGNPLGARNSSFDSVAVGPVKKLGSIAGLTHEMINSSDGQRIVSQTVREDLDLSLDAAMLSSN